MKNIIASIIIPVIQTKFLEGCLSSLYLPEWAEARIFNDGHPEIQDELQKLAEKYNVVLDYNNQCRGFASAVNEGWSRAIGDNPNVEFLGVLNDDTIPCKDWLEELVSTIMKWQADLAAPVQEIPCYKTIDYYEIDGLNYKSFYRNIKKDTKVEAVPGACFLAKRSSLMVVGGFDPEYKNSCEDFDLSLKFIQKSYAMFISCKSRIFHFAGGSRWNKDTVTDLRKSHSRLREKWIR